MLHSHAIETLKPLRALKQQYLRHTTAPLDGMWLCGFVPMAAHYVLRANDEVVGYYCINDDGCLLQFWVPPAFDAEASTTFDAVVSGRLASDPVRGAFVSTAEPRYLSWCLDRFAAFQVNALMYRLGEPPAGTPPASAAPSCALTPIHTDQRPDAVQFAVAAVGAPESWLSQYYAGLIDRGELSALWDGDRIIGLGECRPSHPLQPRVVDLGVMVAPSERGRGLATQILTTLARTCVADGLTPICSTEQTNLAAQRAIRRAGFVADHRIVHFSSPTTDAPDTC